MKILHVVPTYAPAYRYGGPIQSVHALNKYLVRAGAEVTVYTTAIDGPRDLDVPLGVPVDMDGVKVFYFRPSRVFRSWFYSADMRRALAMHIREFDLVHITSVFLSASTLAARAARRTEVPYIISPRGSLMRAPLEKKSSFKKRWYLRLIERRNLENASALHFTAEQEAIEYAQLGYAHHKNIVIPNGLDPEALPEGDPVAFCKKFGIDAKRKIILSLGRLSWKKGMDTLIPAFATVVKELPEALLVLAGGDDENYLSALKDLIDKYGVRENVILTGPLEGTEKSAAYQAASLFALFSYAENFAITVAEAMYFGLPVAITEGVGLAPQVRAADAGLVTPKDVKAVTASLVELLRDPISAKAMGERGRTLVLEKFSYEKVAREFLEAYNQLQ